MPRLNFEARNDYQQALEFFEKQYGQSQEDLNTEIENLEGKQEASGLAEQNFEGEEVEEEEIINASVSSLLGMVSKRKKGQFLNLSKKKERDIFKKKLKQLERKLNEEEIQNMRFYTSRLGHLVMYGHEIQLLHVDSNCFLQGLKQCAQEDNSCNQLQLSTFGSKFVYFKTVGGFRYKQDGDRIHYNDQIVLQHIQTGLFLHVTEKIIKVDGLPGQITQEALYGQALITPKDIDRRQSPLYFSPMCEVNLSSIRNKFSIIIYRYFDEDQNDQFIKGGSVIRCLHSEKGGYLHSDDKDFNSDGLREVYLWNFRGKSTDLEASSSSSLFQIELCVGNQQFKDTSKALQNKPELVSKDQEKPKMNLKDRAGQVFNYTEQNASSQNFENTKKDGKEKMEYRLRHLNTGRLVIDQEIEVEGVKMRTLGLGPHVRIKNLSFFSEKTVEQVGQELKELENIEAYYLEDLRSAVSPKSLEELDQRSRFRIISTNPSLDPRIIAYSCVQIQHVSSEMYLAYDTKAIFSGIETQKNQEKFSNQEIQKINQVKKQNNEEEDDEEEDEKEPKKSYKNFYFAVDCDDIQSGARDAVELKQNRSNEDAFFMIPESYDVLQNILFIQTAIDQLKKYLPIICSSTLEISREKQQKVFDMLDRILKFLIGDTAQDDDNQELPKGYSKEEDDLIQTRQENFKLRQKLMRELYIVEHLVQIIYLPFDHGEYNILNLKGTDLIVKVCRIVYTLLKLIGSRYFQNEMYVSQWINLFFYHAMVTNSSNNLGAEETILVLVDENEKLLKQQITSTIINDFIDLCKKQNRNKKVIQLLAAICAVNNHAVVKNQDDITTTLLEDDVNRAYLMMPLRMRNDGQVEVLIDGSESPPNWLALNNCRKFPKEIYGYFLSIIDLVSELCIDRNPKSLGNLQDMYSFDTVKNVIKNSTLPPETRAIFMRVLMNMHMNREPLEPLQVPSTTGVWNELIPFIREQFLDQNNIIFAIKQSQIEVPSSLITIKKFVENLLCDTNGIMSIFETGKNMLILETLKIVQFMLSHGFYFDLKELKNISKPMIQLLNGSTDIYHNVEDLEESDVQKYLLVKRYFCFADDDLIVQSKIVICQSLLTICKLETDGKAQVFLSKFKGDLDKMFLMRQINVQIPNNSVQYKSDSDEQLPQPVGFFAGIGNFSLSRVAAEQEQKPNQKSMENQNIEFMQQIADFQNFECVGQDTYICVLFDLLLYREEQVSKGAFELLVRFFCRKKILLENLMGIQMLESPKSIKTLNKIKKSHEELRKYIEDADVWLNKSNPRSNKSKQRVTQIFQFYTTICVEQINIQNEKLESQPEEKKELIRQDGSPNHQISAHLDHSRITTKRGNYKLAVQKVNQSDFVLFNKQDQITNKENQRLLGSFGIESIAIFFIKYRVDRNQVNDPFYNDLIQQCYKFLVVYVKDNFTNQFKVYNNLEIFLRDIDKNPLISLLIFEMFRDNKRFLTLNVSKILRTIIIAAEEASLQSSKKALYLKLLEVFCKFEDKLVRPNQQEIVINFTRDIAKNNLIYLFSTEGLPDLIKLLKDCIPGSKNQNSTLDLTDNKISSNFYLSQNINNNQQAAVSMEVLNVIICLNLMSLCCQGKSQIAELKCQTEICNMQTALQLYLCSGRLWPFKSALIRYVAQVFLNSSNSKLFLPGQQPQNLELMKELIGFVLQDIKKIFKEWNDQTNDMNLSKPDGSVTTLNSESKQYAMIYIVMFLKAILKNKKIDLNDDIYPSLHEITAHIAKMYYRTQIEEQKLNALDVLVFINSTERLAHLLEGIQHPANQNIYLETKKGTLDTRIVGVESDNGQKTIALQAKLIQLSCCQNMIKQKEIEFDNFVHWTSNVDSRINSIMNSNELYNLNQQFNMKSFINVSFETVVSSCMTLIDSQCLSKDLHILGLTLLRKCVEIGNPDNNEPSSDWETEEWIQHKKYIQYKQTKLVEIGCAEFLFKHIQEVEDTEIVEEIFLVCISLLVGGNRISQDAFYLYLSEKDPTNIIMQKLKTMIIDQFDLTKKVIGEKNAKLAMVYRANQRLEQRKALEEVVTNKNNDDFYQEPIEFQSFELQDIIQHGVDAEIELEEEESEDDEQQLTVDEDEEDGNEEDLNKSVDETFLVRQTKSQAVLRTIRMLRFLQLLVEGQHLQLQNFLREQVCQNGSTQKSFDFISYVAQMLALYEKQYVNSFSCALGAQLISTLVETIQGPNKQNQMKLVEAKLVDCIRDLINQGQQSQSELKIRGFTTLEKQKHHNSLIQSSVKLLLSIIEGPVDKFVYKQIVNSFDDFLILTKRMEQIYNKFVSEEIGLDPETSNLDEINSLLVKDSFQGSVIEGFDIFSLISQLEIVDSEVKVKIESFIDQDYYQFFQTNTGHVEIQKDGEIMTVYFPIQPMTRRLSDKTKENFNRTVERESNQHKIIDLIAHVPEFIDELEHLEAQSQNTIQITPERFQALRDISTLIAIGINTIIMFLFHYEQIERSDGSKDFTAKIDPIPDTIITWLGYFQLITSVSLLICFIFNRNNIIVRQGWRSKIEENKEKMKLDIKYQLLPLIPRFGELKAKDLPLSACRLLLMTEGPYHEAFIDENGQTDFVYFQLQLEFKWMSLCFLIQDLEFIYFCIYLFFSIQGQKRYPQLQSVIQSVTLNGNQLIATGLLGIIIIYIYSCLAFVFAYDSIYRDELNFGLLNRRGETLCSSMMHCFLTNINLGMRIGGGIGDFLVSIHYSSISESLFFVRAVFDLSYFLIFTTVMLNVIFGIIIDSFAQLRDLKTEMEEDQKNVCFICNIDRQIFERDTEEGFEYHCVNDHDIWQYLNFIIHLKSIDSTELNGTESYILEQFETDDISWFPMQKSQRLIILKQKKDEMKLNMYKDIEDEEGNEVEIDPMTEIQANLETMESLMKQIQKKLS